MHKPLNKLLHNRFLIFLWGIIFGLSAPSFLFTPIKNFVFQQFIAADTNPKQQLTLPSNLISFVSPEGKQLLIESNSKEDYWYLSPQFVTQKSQSFCGVATMVMVLNALSITAPKAPEYYPFNVFTQDNFFNSKARSVIAPEIVSFMGITLEQLGKLLETYPVSVRLTSPRFEKRGF
ncbi:MAG: phytochelatin synthase family protein [Xenococcaceae cyanobacterium]